MLIQKLFHLWLFSNRWLYPPCYLFFKVNCAWYLIIARIIYFFFQNFLFMLFIFFFLNFLFMLFVNFFSCITGWHNPNEISTPSWQVSCSSCGECCIHTRRWDSGMPSFIGGQALVAALFRQWNHYVLYETAYKQFGYYLDLGHIWMLGLVPG